MKGSGGISRKHEETAARSIPVSGIAPNSTLMEASPMIRSRTAFLALALALGMGMVARAQHGAAAGGAGHHGGHHHRGVVHGFGGLGIAGGGFGGYGYFGGPGFGYGYPYGNGFGYPYGYGYGNDYYPGPPTYNATGSLIDAFRGSVGPRDSWR